jgi:tetratricopeptide (TPR) repeat protein
LFNTPSDQTDAQSWYLLGRCYMSQQKYPKAYEAYQQAVYRDGRNPTFWCSIGVLYYQINQYRDALDAYSRAIRLNPNISEVWYDLGTLVSLLLVFITCRYCFADLTFSTNRATIRPATRWMRTAERTIWTPPTLTSKHVLLCSRVSQQLVCQIKATLHFHRTFIHRLTSQVLSVAVLLAHSGVHTRRIHLRLVLRVLRLRLATIGAAAGWPSFRTLRCNLSR